MVHTEEGQACWGPSEWGAGCLLEALRRGHALRWGRWGLVGQALLCKAPELLERLLVPTFEGGMVLNHVGDQGQMVSSAAEAPIC